MGICMVMQSWKFKILWFLEHNILKDGGNHDLPLMWK